MTDRSQELEELANKFVALARQEMLAAFAEMPEGQQYDPTSSLLGNCYAIVTQVVLRDELVTPEMLRAAVIMLGDGIQFEQIPEQVN